MSESISLDLQMKIASLKDSILNVHPSLPIILKEIHTMLKQDPAMVTVLSEEDIGVLVSGLKQQTKTEITAATLKKKVPLKNVSLMDL